MRILVDTHVWLWMRLAPKRMSLKARRTVDDTRNELLFSAVSTAELALKIAAGKLTLPIPLTEFVEDGLVTTSTIGLPLTHAHAVVFASVPVLHGDPFDRMLIAQARAERVPILTADAAFDAYGVKVLAAT